MNEDIRIYVADLSAYNNGKLHGVWINALDDLDEIQEQINTMLKDSPGKNLTVCIHHSGRNFSP